MLTKLLLTKLPHCERPAFDGPKTCLKAKTVTLLGKWHLNSSNNHNNNGIIWKAGTLSTQGSRVGGGRHQQAVALWAWRWWWRCCSRPLIPPPTHPYSFGVKLSTIYFTLCRCNAHTHKHNHVHGVRVRFYAPFATHHTLSHMDLFCTGSALVSQLASTFGL